MNSLFRKKKVEDILKMVSAHKLEPEHESLGKHLKVRDLAAFGIAAIIGAGIFSTIGKASSEGGPAVIFLFLFTALACGFAAFAYAEFASMVPVAGSAYTYSYVAFGEIVAWIIGWALIMEYAIGNITVAISWSDYFTSMLEGIHIKSLGIKGIHLPQWVQMDYLTASNGFQEATTLMQGGKKFNELSDSLINSYYAWKSAPNLFGFHLILDIPALFIIVLITWLVYRGMKESRNASNAMVVVKLAIILLVIAVGVFYIDTDNWSPFAPKGISGILKGVSAVFFAYIGFDAISTTAEECENPQRDLPIGLLASLVFCTLVYIVVSGLLTGIVPYSELNVSSPVAFALARIGHTWSSTLVATGVLAGLITVLLVLLYGLTRILFAMSRDGLISPVFSIVNPDRKTPTRIILMCGLVVSLVAGFIPLGELAETVNIGTLASFVMVCVGVIVLRIREPQLHRPFKNP